MEPACVKACPTGALSWGVKEKMLKVAEKRVKDLGGDATTYGDKYVKGTHFMYVLKEKPEVYADIHKDPSVPLVGHALEELAEAFELTGSWRRGGRRVYPLHHARPQDAA